MNPTGQGHFELKIPAVVESQLRQISVWSGSHVKQFEAY